MPALLPSELPVLAIARRHWIVLFRKPSKVLTIAVLVMVVVTIFAPNPMLLFLILLLTAAVYVRLRTWRSERVILTRRRIVRVYGIPETTTTEASLRLDRVSGAVVEQTVLGKLLDYGTIQLEAPGPHPDVRELHFIARPNRFYLQIRKVVFGTAMDLDPDDGLDSLVTAPLPVVDRRPRRPE
jgi:uncharacterized membrane protein YdbT with pleckstrin-like domain